MNQSNPSINNNELNVDTAFRTAAFIFFANLISTGGWLFISLKFGAWQLYLLTGLLGVFSIASVAAMMAVRRGKAETGGWVIIAGVVALLSVGAFLNTGVALTAGIAIIILVNLIANQMLAAKAKRLALMISIVAGILTALIDQSNSEYRLLTPGIQNILPVITILAALLLIFFIVRQSWGFVVRSLRLKIAVWTGLIIAGSTIILIGYSTVTGIRTTIAGAEKEALSIASEQAQAVRVQAEIPLNTARALAQSFQSLKDPSYDQSLTRDQVNGMLRQVLIENPGFLGTYTLWEPNAFDGLDADFKNTPAHDATGRFIPYWVRSDNGAIDVQALIDYETPGIGDWYILPRQTKREVTIAPLTYPINGVDTVMASFVVPIIYNDKFYGIAGVDAPIGFVQGIVDQINLYNGNAQAILMTANGTLIGVRNRPDLAFHPATEIFPNFADLQDRMVAGELFFSLSPDGNYLHVFAPVDLGLSGEHWSFALIIPMKEITAPATASAIRQGGIGLGLVLLAIALLWVLSGQTVRPLASLTLAAEELSKGNFTVKAKVESVDETGLLASAFNLMSSQLQGFISTLEQRVADRTKNLVLAAEVGRAVSQVRALDVMLTDATELIRKQFDLYYVQVYLVNPSQTYLDLQAGTGHVGKELLGRKHRLPLNTGSINGRAAIDKRSVVISDTTASATFRPNVLLPDTRSEMAVPLLIGDRVVGVLDMQSTVAGSLSQDAIPAFEALAGQMAIAVQNANLLAETEKARVEIETQARRQTRSNWNEYMDAIHMPEKTGFVFEQNTVSALNEDEQPKENAMQAAIAITGEPLGNLVVEMEGQSPISRTDELLNTVARQISQQIESLRLLESAERYRLEAEEVSRRNTREGWKAYTLAKADEGLSYLYDLKEVRAADGEQQPIEGATSQPLMVRNEAIGQLIIQGLDAGDVESLELVTAVAERLGAHIESLRQFEETQTSLAETQSLYRINASIASNLELDILYQQVAELLCTEMEFTGSWIAVYEPGSETIRGVAGVNVPEERMFSRSSITEKTPANLAAQIRQLVKVNDPHQDERLADLPAAERAIIGKSLSAPVMIGQELLGVLSVTRPENGVDIDPREERMCQAIAVQLAIVMQRVKLFEQVQKQAERETTLNLISQKIQSATTVEAVLQVAARELGHALGAPMTIAQLSMKDKK